MRILFYINEYKSDLIDKFTYFLENMLEYNEYEIIVLCENESDKRILDNLKNNKRNLLRVINVYELLQNKIIFTTSEIYRTNNNNNKLLFVNQYSNIEKQRGCNDEDISGLYLVIQSVLDQYDIKSVCYCNCMLFIFRSIGLLILHDIVRSLNIPFYWITHTPIKGRFAVYDNLFYEHKKIAEDYQIILKKTSSNSINEYDNFFQKYLDFKINTQMPFFEKSNIQSRKNKKLQYKISEHIKKIIIICNSLVKGQYRNLKYEESNISKPYILFLLTKPDHWFTNYANNDLVDRVYLIKNIWKSIPSGFDLILKKHPSMAFDEEIESVVYGLPHCYLGDNISTINLVKNASIIIFSGTTSGVESLMQEKQVIEIGKRSIIFNMKDPPIKRITNFMELPKKINECLKEAPPKAKINAFFKSLLKNSYSFNENFENISLNRNSNSFRRMAEILSQKLKSDAGE